MAVCWAERLLFAGRAGLYTCICFPASKLRILERKLKLYDGLYFFFMLLTFSSISLWKLLCKKINGFSMKLSRCLDD